MIPIPKESRKSSSALSPAMGNRALLFAHPLFDAGHLVILILNSFFEYIVCYITA